MARTSTMQYETMVEFMERNGDILRPQGGSSGRIQQDVQWRQLTNLLNSDGTGGVKSLESWKKVWSDLKSKTKKKKATLNRDVRGTGGGESRARPLSQLEERVLAIMGTIAVFGLPNVREMGFLIPQTSSPTPLSPAATETTPQSVPSFSDTSMFQVNLLPSQDLSTLPPSVSIEPDQVLSIPPSPVRTPSNRRRRMNPVGQSPRGFRRMPTGYSNFDRATSEFAKVENRRLQLEEDRNRREHEWKMAQLDRENEWKTAQLDIQRKQLDLFSEFNAQLGVISTAVKTVADVLVKQYREP